MQFVERVKTEIPRRIPSTGGGTNVIDLSYNPSINEDYFFQTAEGRGPK